jgi:CDP-diacylglycerol--glycerol-3-phosphate 3-phosphatidyltransferase
MNEQTKNKLRVLIQPPVRLLAATGIAPNAITVFGLVLSIGAGFLLSQGSFIWAGVVFLLGGLSDVLDGELARRSNRAHPRGAFLDSSFDRISEFAVFFGIFWYFRSSTGMAALAFGALFASVAVSYVRARAEGVGVECRIGLFERPIRFVFLVAGIFFHRYINVALWIILVGSAFTVVQRIVYVLGKTRQPPMDAKGKSPRSGYEPPTGADQRGPEESKE